MVMVKGVAHSSAGSGHVQHLNVPPRRVGISGFLGFSPALIVLLVITCLIPPVMSTYWTFNVMVGLVLGIACLGLLVVVGWGREISLAQAGLVGSATYLSGWLYRSADKNGPTGGNGRYGKGWTYPMAVLGGIVFVVACSVIVAFISMRLAGVYVIVLTLSLQFLLENSIMLSEKLTGGLAAPSTPRPDFFGINMRADKHFFYYILGALVVCMLFLNRFRHSRFGRSMMMVGSDKAAAAAVGVSPWGYKVAAFGIAGVFAGVAGGLSAPLYFSPPGSLQYISFNSLFYLSVPILAGFESMTATIIVAVVFTLIPQIVLSWKINVYLLGGLGLTAGILVGPRGVGGTVIDLLDPRARAKKRAARHPAPTPPPTRPTGGARPTTRPTTTTRPTSQLGAKR